MDTQSRGPTKTRIWIKAIAGASVLVLSLVFVMLLPAAARPADETSSKTGNANSTSDLCWHLVSNPGPDTQGIHLYAVGGAAANDVWAVGSYETISGTLALVQHWDGTRWSAVSGPGPGAYSNSLNGIAVVSANDVWAVGYYSDGTSSPTRTLIEHWDGAAWSVVPSPNPSVGNSYLYGVAAVASDDVWAVGYYQNESASRIYTLAEHWDGAAWSVIPSPNPASDPYPILNYLYGVTAASANDVWAVGSYDCHGLPAELIEHWDGVAWSAVATCYQGSSLYGVSAASANDVWAVGTLLNVGGPDPALVQHYDGTTWSTVPSPNLGQDTWLYGVAGVSANDVWAVGYYDSVTEYPHPTLIEHWDGTAWSMVANPSEGGHLYGVAAVSPNDVWAVGDYGLIEHYSQCGVCTIEYPDVPPGSTYYEYVHCLSCRNVISGYADGTFGPYNPVTRGQLAKIVSNAAGYTEYPLGQTFQDVDTLETPFWFYIGRLYAHGAIQGYPCGNPEPCVPPFNLPYFRPGANVTRGQTSKIVATTKGLPAPSPDQQAFEDVAPNSTFWQWIEPLAATGAIGGYPCGGEGEPCVPPNNKPYFRPGANVTRGQSTKIVAGSFFPGCQTSQQK